MIKDVRKARLDPAVIAGSFLANVFALALPLALLQVFDRVVPNRGFETLTILAAGLIVVTVLDFVIRVARYYIVSLSTMRFALSAHWQACQRILHPNIEGDFLIDRKLFEKFDAIARVRRHYSGEIAIALYDIPFVVLFIGVILVISPIMGLGAALLSIASLAIVARHRRRIIALGQERIERSGRRNSFLAETLSRIEMIKALGVEADFERRYEKLMSVNATHTKEYTERVSFTQGLAGTISLVSPVIMACLGSFLVIDGEMTMGGLAAAILLTNRVIQPVLRIEALIAGERDIRSQVEDVEELLAAPLAHHGRQAVERIDSLELDGVSWAAAPDAAPILSDVRLSLKRGDAITIDGHDEKASTTLLSLLSGLLPATSGEVRVDGVPIHELAPVMLSGRIAHLSAEHVMLEGTLLENMTRFDPERNRDEAFELARRLGVDGFISGLPKGFSTTVSAQMATLLPKAVHDCVLVIGGLVSRPDVIILDDVTVALDSRLKTALTRLLAQLRPDVILVVVTYQPSMQSLADRHYRLQDGRLVETTQPVARRRPNPTTASLHPVTA